MAVLKILFQMCRKKVSSPLAKCQLIRYIKEVLLQNTSLDGRTQRGFVDYLEVCLRPDSEMVNLEAARALIEVSERLSFDIEHAFSSLQSLIQSSNKPVNKYAALKVLNRLASRQPKLVAMCGSDLEALITDANRCVASMAISTLLKTCSDNSVAKLLKQVSHYLSDLGDDFKIEVIESVRKLFERMPAKADALLRFLNGCLKGEASLAFKEAVVETIMGIALECPQEEKESALLHLAEYIEDCEFPALQSQVLHFLAAETPKSRNPSTYTQ